MSIVRYFFDVPPPHEPRPPSSSSDSDGDDGVPIVILLGIIAAYAYGYAELVQFIGLAGIWAALLFLPFTITLIMIPAAILVVFDFISGAETNDGHNLSERKNSIVGGKSTDDGYRDDEGGSYDEETGFRVEVERVNRVTVATVKGRIDAKNIGELEQVIRSEIGVDRPVILDVSNVPYISSSGLRMVLLLMRSFNEKGLSFALAAPRPSVRELLDVSGFTYMLLIHKDLAAAIAAIADVEYSEQ
ncbi:MAG: STAS domain-containing protein [Rhodospirillales bacterium]|nr:STAS domain-containing protein [Rhodospirillales bacterium]